jgi:hypothetical protein
MAYEIISTTPFDQLNSTDRNALMLCDKGLTLSDWDKENKPQKIVGAYLHWEKRVLRGESIS